MSALAGIVTPDGVDTGKLLEPAIQLVAALSSDVAAAVEFTVGGGVLGLLAILSGTTHRVRFHCLRARSTARTTTFPVPVTVDAKNCVHDNFADACMPSGRRLTRSDMLSTL